MDLSGAFIEDSYQQVFVQVQHRALTYRARRGARVEELALDVGGFSVRGGFIRSGEPRLR